VYTIEFIPDADRLFRRFNFEINLNKKGEIKANAFRESGEGLERGMSCDWDKYSMPIDTKNRSPDPSKCGVLTMQVGAIRAIKLKVTHDPINPNAADRIGNQSHAIVTGIDQPDPAEATAIRGRIITECNPIILIDFKKPD